MFEHALEALKNGELIACPTDTVYGVTCDASNLSAVQKLYGFKQRPASQPLQILVNSFAMAESLAEFSPQAQKLAAAFWPGALTLILPRKVKTIIAPKACGNQPTIGLRWPASDVTDALIKELGKPLAASSANKRGDEPLNESSIIARQFPELTLIAGSPSGAPSSVVRFDKNHFTFLREGHITKEQIESALR